MKNPKTSAKISLAICILSAAVLAVWLFTFPRFLQWFYVSYHGLNPAAAKVEQNEKIIITVFYVCAPFAAAALYMLIRLLGNILKDQVFIADNVRYLRLISWCCYAVALAAAIGGIWYVPIFIIAFSTGVVGTLLRVVKNVIHAAVALREENDLTI